MNAAVTDLNFSYWPFRFLSSIPVDGECETYSLDIIRETFASGEDATRRGVERMDVCHFFAVDLVIVVQISASKNRSFGTATSAWSQVSRRLNRSSATAAMITAPMITRCVQSSHAIAVAPLQIGRAHV